MRQLNDPANIDYLDKTEERRVYTGSGKFTFPVFNILSVPK